MICRSCALGLLLACAWALAPASARGEDAGEAVVEDGVWEDVEEGAWDEPGEDRGGVYDPWEGVNRPIFAFNEFLDRWLVEPLAIGWDFLVPDLVQEGIDNFFDNVGTPRRIVNDLLQGKAAKAGNDTGRFMLNTTWGIGGLLDLATLEGLPPADEDFGQTLAVWGAPAGPYLVLPFLGPSNPRDTAGRAVEGFVLSPEFYFLPFYVSYISTGTRLLNDRALALETVRAERAAAFDFYAAVRRAYVQYRDNQVRDRAADPEDEDEDLYHFEDEEDEDL